MADMQELEIKIDGDGNVTVRVIGGDGAKCVDLTKEIEAALGDVLERKLTEEYYQEPVEEHTEQQLDGGGQ